MSGITPLLDTLLHQVLGKRVEIPPPQDLNRPVRPLSPSDATPALGREARADPRAARLNAPPAAPGRSAPPAAPAPLAPAAGPGSTHTHFSVAARAIADILARFPAPPAALRPATPLLAPGQAPDAGVLAGRLQASIDNSGLFYESHLQRWFRGEIGARRLAREPHMVLTGRHAPAPGTVPTAMAGPLATPAPGVPPLAAPGGGRAAGPAPEFERAPLATPREPVHEALHGVLRHQLEMLATPVLRWEGDVWSGLFMALMIQPPPDSALHAQADGGQGDAPPGPAWHSDLRLRGARLGEIQVRLNLAGANLALNLVAATPASAESLRGAGDALRSRLLAVGFQTVHLAVTVAAPGLEGGGGE